MGISLWGAARMEDDAIGKLTLDELRQAALALLEEGASDPGSPLRKPVLATVDSEAAPQARTVILRGFEPGCRRLEVYTDARAAKADELAANPLAAFAFYDPRREVQLRLTGRIEIHRHDELAERAWEMLGPRQIGDYLARATPGSPSAEPGPDRDGEGKDETARRDAARANFAVLAFTYDRLDMLVLGRALHRRALFEWTKTPASAPDSAAFPVTAPDRAVWLVP